MEQQQVEAIDPDPVEGGPGRVLEVSGVLARLAQTGIGEAGKALGR
jgi:hypothetical protein